MENLGDKVFIPSYGAGVVINIEYKEIKDIVCKFIGISLLVDNINLLIPENKIEAYKMRDVVTMEEMERCLNIITQDNIVIEKKWGRRYRQNNLKISSGDLEKQCEVLRDLYFLKRNDLLPPGEQKILDKAESMVTSEIVLVKSIEIKEAYRKLRDLGKQNIK